MMSCFSSPRLAYLLIATVACGGASAEPAVDAAVPDARRVLDCGILPPDAPPPPDAAPVPDADLAPDAAVIPDAATTHVVTWNVALNDLPSTCAATGLGKVYVLEKLYSDPFARWKTLAQAPCAVGSIAYTLEAPAAEHQVVAIKDGLVKAVARLEPPIPAAAAVTLHVFDEPVPQLNAIAQGAVDFYAMNGRFPDSVASETPADDSCCGNVQDLCPVNAADWETPEWMDLGFAVTRRGRYWYNFRNYFDVYFRANAYGNFDCDGDFSTYEVSGVVGPTGVYVMPMSISGPSD